MHATRFLKPNDKTAVPGVVALVGSQRHLKLACLKALTRRVLGDDGDAGPSRYAGAAIDLKSVLDELSTVSMWGGSRLVMIEEADPFVTANRAALERYAAKPASGGVLVLDVKTWPKTTKLAKAVAATGLELECGDLTGADLRRWLAETAQEVHGKKLDRDAADLLAELAGPDLTNLDTELAKLSDFVGDGAEISLETVTKLVGGGKAESAFKMLEHLQEGQLGAAITELDRLLRAGEAPQRILGAVTYSYRKLAAAYELCRRGTQAGVAVRTAGVLPRDQQRAAAYLQRVGRVGGRFFACILEADAALRGFGRLPERVVMERLLTHLAGSSAGRSQPTAPQMSD